MSDAEYHNHLMVDGWTRAETDHLLDLCSRFDLRFPVIHDRWNRQVQAIEIRLSVFKSAIVALTVVWLVSSWYQWGAFTAWWLYWSWMNSKLFLF